MPMFKKGKNMKQETQMLVNVKTLLEYAVIEEASAKEVWLQAKEQLVLAHQTYQDFVIQTTINKGEHK